MYTADGAYTPQDLAEYKPGMDAHQLNQAAGATLMDAVRQQMRVEIVAERDEASR